MSVHPNDRAHLQYLQAGQRVLAEHDRLLNVLRQILRNEIARQWAAAVAGLDVHQTNDHTAPEYLQPTPEEILGVEPLNLLKPGYTK